MGTTKERRKPEHKALDEIGDQQDRKIVQERSKVLERRKMGKMGLKLRQSCTVGKMETSHKTD